MNAIKWIFSKHLIHRMEQRGILKSWMEETVDKPELEVTIAADEVHFYKRIESEGNKWLKVVVNPQNKVMVTVYFDRNIVKRIQNEDDI